MKPKALLEITPEYVVECFKRHNLKPKPGTVVPVDGGCCALGAVAADFGADKASTNARHFQKILNDHFTPQNLVQFALGFDRVLGCWISYDKNEARRMQRIMTSPEIKLGGEIAIACGEAFYP